MSQHIKVKELVTVSSDKTKWLNNMLAPYVASCNFANVPGINFTNLNLCGKPFGGRASRENYGNTVDLGLQSVFLSKNSLAFAYVHECTHILIFAEERKRGRVTENHGPIFFLTNCALSHRIDIKTDDNYFFNKISFYSYQDCPFDESWTVEESKSAVVTFCLKNYKQLATSDLTAEDLTTKAWDLWDIEKSELIEKKKKANDFEQKMEHLKGVNEQLAAANEKLQDEKNKLQQFVENSKGWKFIYLTDWLTVYIICAVIGVAVFSVGVGVGMSNTKHTSEAQKK